MITAEQSRIIYLSELNPRTDEASIIRHFRECGTIEKARVIRDWKKISRTHAYVVFDSHESAVRACQMKDESYLDSKCIFVELNRSPKMEERLLASDSKPEIQPFIIPQIQPSTLAFPEALTKGQAEKIDSLKKELAEDNDSDIPNSSDSDANSSDSSSSKSDSSSDSDKKRHKRHHRHHKHHKHHHKSSKEGHSKKRSHKRRHDDYSPSQSDS